MKTSFKLLCVAIASLVFSLPVYSGDDDIDLIIAQSGSGGDVIHREQIPITCTLLPETILVNYLLSLGPVSIEIENQTTGEYSQTLVNALAGPMVLPISGSAGQWTIMFTLPSGVQYYGEFDIL